MIPYLIAGAIGFVVAKIFDEDEEPKYEDGGKVDLSYEVPNLDEKITFHEFEYEFKTENNVKYVVQCLIRWREQEDVIRYTDKNGVKKRRLKERADMVLSIQFATKSRAKDKYGNNNISLRVKNKGEVYRVMATIVKIVKKILKEKTDITFVQFKPMGIDEGDNRRLILYTRAIKKEYPNSLIETGYGEYVLDKKGFENFNTNFFGIKINRKQMKFAKGGSVLLAPNGKPSNLTPEQYKLVRKPEFKSWFGDWENDPENSSKVVDSNGEPLIVYHGSSVDFNLFENKPREIGRRKTSAKGFYFTKDKWSATQYAGSDGFVKSYFLKILNYPSKQDKEVLEYSDIDDYLFDYGKTIDRFGYDGAIDVQGDFIVWNPEQIKLADGTNTTFDSNNNDIRFDKGGELIGVIKIGKDIYISKNINELPKE
jgi:hypothetical protein